VTYEGFPDHRGPTVFEQSLIPATASFGNGLRRGKEKRGTRHAAKCPTPRVIWLTDFS
jgi:hypothetical protein